MSPKKTKPKLVLTDRLARGLELASEVHGNQRKKTGAPVLSHLLEVCGYVLRGGGDEDQAVAGLLHDAAEKGGGRSTLARIQQEFGDRVGKIVLDCTDSFEGEPRPKWRTLKELQIERFRREAIPESCLVYAADKLSNSYEIERRLHREGPEVWSDYGGGREGHLWYFRAMYEVFLERGGVNPIFQELGECLSRLEKFSGIEESEQREVLPVG